jgi:GTPase SAR1 family protein
MSSSSNPLHNLTLDALRGNVQFQYLRVLVIGRANSGKTTILKRICNSIEDPEIFSPDGEKVLRASKFLLNCY